MTGDQPDGALLHCPGPPAAAEVPLDFKLEHTFLSCQGIVGARARFRWSYWFDCDPRDPAQWGWASFDRLMQYTSNWRVATPPEVETTGSGDKTSSRFAEPPDRQYGSLNRTLSFDFGRGWWVRLVIELRSIARHRSVRYDRR